jgi:hypothetical protein
LPGGDALRSTGSSQEFDSSRLRFSPELTCCYRLALHSQFTVFVRIIVHQSLFIGIMFSKQCFLNRLVESLFMPGKF